jgi:hypothetical protein
MSFVGPLDFTYFEEPFGSPFDVTGQDLKELFDVDFAYETVFKIADCFKHNSELRELFEGVKYFFFDFYEEWGC